VESFERELALALGARHACAVSSGTAALHLALKAIGVGPGDEVITVSHSFIATANSIRYLGATPVFVDIDHQTYNLDPELIDRVCTARTRAILCVHQLGMPCDLERIIEIAGAKGLPVIEDAACAIGSEIRVGQGEWERIGKPHSDIACFSFHPRKILTTGEGGMVVCRDQDLDRRCRQWRNHGLSIASEIDRKYTDIGYNYRMSDIHASIGRVQLTRLDEMILERRRQARGYMELLSDIEGLDLPYEPRWARSNWQSYCIRLPKNVSQSRVISEMNH
jgi:dTDP-4-amino-4,6-dideoxygalactose transaminase